MAQTKRTGDRKYEPELPLDFSGFPNPWSEIGYNPDDLASRISHENPQSAFSRFYRMHQADSLMAEGTAEALQLARDMYLGLLSHKGDLSLDAEIFHRLGKLEGAQGRWQLASGYYDTAYNEYLQGGETNLFFSGEVLMGKADALAHLGAVSSAQRLLQQAYFTVLPFKDDFYLGGSAAADIEKIEIRMAELALGTFPDFE